MVKEPVLVGLGYRATSLLRLFSRPVTTLAVVAETTLDQTDPPLALYERTRKKYAVFSVRLPTVATDCSAPTPATSVHGPYTGSSYLDNKAILIV